MTWSANAVYSWNPSCMAYICHLLMARKMQTNMWPCFLLQHGPTSTIAICRHINWQNVALDHDLVEVILAQKVLHVLFHWSCDLLVRLVCLKQAFLRFLQALAQLADGDGRPAVEFTAAELQPAVGGHPVIQLHNVSSCVVRSEHDHHPGVQGVQIWFARTIAVPKQRTRDSAFHQLSARKHHGRTFSLVVIVHDGQLPSGIDAHQAHVQNAQVETICATLQRILGLSCDFSHKSSSPLHEMNWLINANYIVVVDFKWF